MIVVFFFKQKTAYEMRISDWSSDVCSSDLERSRRTRHRIARAQRRALQRVEKSRRVADAARGHVESGEREQSAITLAVDRGPCPAWVQAEGAGAVRRAADRAAAVAGARHGNHARGNRDRKSTRLNSSH